MFSRISILIVGCILASGLSGCDSVPGPEEEGRRPPVVSNLSFSPLAVLIDHLPPGSVTDGRARFSVHVEVDASDENGDLDRIFIYILSPIQGVGSVAQEEILAVGNLRYQADLDLDIPVGAIGAYVVHVSAADESGRLSNDALGSFRVDATGSPPVIESVDVPERVIRPAAGQPPVLIPLVARVSDPDGPLNILRVEVLVNNSVTLQLCDDGGEATCNAVGFGPSGDEVASDGLFTVTIQLDASNAAGDNLFVFKAIDRSGLESNSVSRTIKVE